MTSRFYERDDVNELPDEQQRIHETLKNMAEEIDDKLNADTNKADYGYILLTVPLGTETPYVQHISNIHLEGIAHVLEFLASNIRDSINQAQQEATNSTKQ